MKSTIFSITNPKKPPIITTNIGANGPAIVETELVIPLQISIIEYTTFNG
jgi:hypothetical protein